MGAASARRGIARAIGVRFRIVVHRLGFPEKKIWESL